MKHPRTIYPDEIFTTPDLQVMRFFEVDVAEGLSSVGFEVIADRDGSVALDFQLEINGEFQRVRMEKVN